MGILINENGSTMKIYTGYCSFKIEVAKAKDLLRIYGIDDKIINTYTDKQIHYMLFDNSFSGIKSNLQNDELILSYSQINEYN